MGFAGIATASLLSQLISSKYQYGLPFYRQEAMFKKYGIELSGKTMSDWIIKSARHFTPLVEVDQFCIVGYSTIIESVGWHIDKRMTTEFVRNLITYVSRLKT